MRILYVTRESPIQPSGGIGTYIDYMVRAMAEAGHEVFLFTWVEGSRPLAVLDYAPFPRENVRIQRVSRAEAFRRTPIREPDLAMAELLAPRILQAVRDWRIDVVEATDFLAPALPVFQALQTAPGAQDVLCVTYNHGFVEDFHEADQIRTDEHIQTDLLGERQQCRVSDVVVAPSACARDRLASYGIRDHVAVVREPYRFGRRAPVSGVRHDLTYFGRISVSKGIDKIILFANATHPVFGYSQIKLVGRVIPTPFRRHEMDDYVRARIAPELRDRVFFTDFLDRGAALDMLEPGAICPSLGSAETFSYACIESIDCGLIPVVRHGTPMAEFVPAELQHHVLDERMRSVRDLQRQFERTVAEAPAFLEGVRAHCEETLAPEKIAAEMTELYETRLARKKGLVSAAVRAPMQLRDVTILIPAWKPTREFAETVDSLARQTTGAPRVLICDDGTPADRGEWFTYAETVLPECTVIRQPNTGLLGARNTLAESCETPLCLFLDTDDMLAPTALEDLLGAWNNSVRRPDAVIPQRANFLENSELVLRSLLDDHLHLLDNDFRMTALLSTEVLREIGFDTTRRNGEGDDWAFWLEFSGRGHYGVLLPKPVFFYRFRKGSMSWPWSEGQDVGTQAMVRAVAAETCRRNPAHAETLARAMYARAVRRPAQ